jgi:hypothetical protein
MHAVSRVHDLFRQFVFRHAASKTIARKARQDRQENNPALTGDQYARCSRDIVHNPEMAPVDSEELQAVLATEIATVVAVDPEGSESYRSRN